MLGFSLVLLGTVFICIGVVDIDFCILIIIGIIIGFVGVAVLIDKDVPEQPSISITKESLIKTGNATYSTSSGVFILKDGLMEVK